MTNRIRRREFITLLGGAAAAWPLAARAQQPALPVIGFLSARSPGVSDRLVRPFREGLAEAGFVDGQNVNMQYRWAEGDYERLRGLAVDLVERRVAVIAAISGTPAALAAKAATSTIPIVFANGGDPVTSGLVASLARPGGNMTGATFLSSSTVSKRLQVLRDLMPAASRLGFLANPNNPIVVPEIADAMAAAHALGFELQIVNARSTSELENAFEMLLLEPRVDALLVASDPFFGTEAEQLAGLATRFKIPIMSSDRSIVEAGGLLSYGGRVSDTYRQAGNYAARILKGARPADLPVVLPINFELVVNLKTAKVLGLTVSNAIQLLADEVIE